MIRSLLYKRLPTERTRSEQSVLAALCVGAMLAIVVVLVGGCVSLSPPGEVDAVGVDDVQRASGDVTYTVRWGGTIVEVENGAAATTLQIVSRPLNRSGRPLRNDVSDGRFLAVVEGFLDPEIVKTGRDITVLGTVNEIRQGEVGEAQYRFPVVAVRDWRYWKPVVQYPAPFYYPYPAPYYYPYPNPAWWWNDDWHDWPHRYPDGPRSHLYLGVQQ